MMRDVDDECKDDDYQVGNDDNEEEEEEYDDDDDDDDDEDDTDDDAITMSQFNSLKLTGRSNNDTVPPDTVDTSHLDIKDVFFFAYKKMAYFLVMSQRINCDNNVELFLSSLQKLFFSSQNNDTDIMTKHNSNGLLARTKIHLGN